MGDETMETGRSGGKVAGEEPEVGRGGVRRVLGLVPDVDSCGWCLIEHDALLREGRVLGMGVHAYECPRDPKTKVSLARKRKAHHYARINRRRTAYRAKHVLAVLVAHGLVPKGEGASWLQSRRGEVPIPGLRAQLLDRAGTPRELAQVLYYFALHRGHATRGGEADDADGKQILSAVAANAAVLAEGGYRTLGEMLAARGRMRNRGGDYAMMASREMVEDEARALVEAQARLCGADAADWDGLLADYMAELLWERSSAQHDARVAGMVGRCTYFADERRAASCDLSCEMLVALERLKHLRYVRDDGSSGSLPPDLVRRYMGQLFSASAKGATRGVRYSDVRRDLAMPEGWSIKGVAADDERRDVAKPKAWSTLRRTLPEGLLERMLAEPDMADAVCEALAYASSEPVLLDRLALLPYELSDDELSALCRVPYASKVFSGHGARSLKAVGLLLDALEDDGVETLWDAERESGLLALREEAESAHEGGHMLPPYLTYDPTCTNPIVIRAMTRMRKVVNAVVAAHGMPDEVRIEVGAELRRSNREKWTIAKNNARNRKQREADAALAADALGVAPEEVGASALRRVALWREQGGVDVLTGEEIDLARACADGTYAHACHILPLSRTGDDGSANLVLALAKTAQDKGARSPWEWLGGEGEAWDAFELRVASSGLPAAKRSRLLARDLEGRQDELLGKHLADTRYMSQAARSYVGGCLALARGATAVSGMAVGVLSRVWGLRRLDGVPAPVMPAVKAAVVAACDAPALRACGRWSESRLCLPPDERERALAQTEPWPTYAAEVRASSAFVTPTRSVSERLRGEALEQTVRAVRAVDQETGFAVLSGATKRIGNYRILPDGSARVVSEMACLRLWLDPDAEAGGRRKGRGRYYAEPVYRADAPALRAGTHEPRTPRAGHARVAWGAVPDGARQAPPLTIWPGQLVSARGVVGRYRPYGIANNRWIMDDPRTGEELKGFPTIASLCLDDEVRVVGESSIGPRPR